MRAFCSYIQDYLYLKREMAGAGIQGLSFSEMKQRKTSDIVYILGSGASLNKLTSQQWDNIFKSDTISFNFFLAHAQLSDLRFPTFHFMEFPMKGRENQLDLLSKIISERSPLFKKHGTPFIARYRRFRETGLGIDYFPEEMHSEVRLALPHLFHLADEVKMKRMLRVLDMAWISSGIDEMSPFVYHAGSISYTTLFAYMLGYRRIVLLGVDLNNPYYFWDQGDELFYQECRELRSSVFSGFSAHVTAMADVVGKWGQMPVDRFLYCINESIFKRRGVTLTVGSAESMLANYFPVENI